MTRNTLFDRGAAIALPTLAAACLAAAILAAPEAFAQEPAAAKVLETAAGGDSHKWWLPEDVSAHGDDMDGLFYVILVITGIVFVAVEVALVWFVVQFRHRPGRKAAYIHGHRGLEVTWSAATVGVLMIIILMTRQSWSELTMTEIPEDAAIVDVQGKQFTWNFTLPGSGEKYGKTSDIKTPERLIHVQELKPVVFNLSSIDVIHSFFIPQLRVKHDVVPGHPGRVWFTPIQRGKYEIVCAELCGGDHFTMRGVLVVDSAEDYEKWIQAELQFLEDKPK